jgi:hypothetical protein
LLLEPLPLVFHEASNSRSCPAKHNSQSSAVAMRTASYLQFLLSHSTTTPCV